MRLFLAVLRDMRFCGLLSMASRVECVAHCRMSMMGRFFVMSGVVMFGGFVVVPRDMRSVFRCLAVMFRSLFRHGVSYPVLLGVPPTHANAPRSWAFPGLARRDGELDGPRMAFVDPTASHTLSGAERKAGQLLKEMADNGERAKGGEVGRRELQPATLDDLGISKTQSSR
jgi:hypothetical protein